MKKHLLFIILGYLLSTFQISGQEYLLFEESSALIALRKSVLDGNIPKKYKSRISKLVIKADKALTAEIPSVTYKKSLPASGNKHDYFSTAPYFWPDESKSDSLPWIRRDGEVNPMTKVGDNIQKDKMFGLVNTLSGAYYITNDMRYARQANKILYAWFIDEDLKMNPNVDYGQAIPGLNDGRPFGLIEWTGLTDVLRSAQILDKYGQLEPKVKKGLNEWVEQFAKWMATGSNALEEDNTINNHGSWFDNTITSLFLYKNDIKSLKSRLEVVKTKRIAAQIKPDGSMPHELARTKSLSYTIMNTKALLQLCYLGKRFNIDLYHYRCDGSGSVKDAVKFLTPYAFGEKWPYQQITAVEEDKILSVLNYAANMLDDKELTNRLSSDNLSLDLLNQYLSH